MEAPTSTMFSGLAGSAEAIMHEVVNRPIPIIIASILATLIALGLRGSALKSMPGHFLNPKSVFELSQKRATDDYMANARKMMLDWFAKNPNKPVTMMTDAGFTTLLPPDMANEIRNDQRLSFSKVAMKAFHSDLHGFEPFRSLDDDILVKEVVRKNLTQRLSTVTGALAEETSMALEDLLGNSTEWHDVHLRGTVLDMISRISSRVFLGEELCRNKEWLHVTKEYTVTSFKAAEDLRRWHWSIRPIANIFLSQTRTMRAMVADSRRVIAPVLEKRKQLREAALAAGEKPNEFNDALKWFEDAKSGREYDAALSQLVLSLAAIHTTSDLLSQTLINICEHPEIIKPLREEVISVYREDGWKKTALYKMKLLDSVIKESQRIKPISMISMTRIALERVTLSDGTVIPKDHTVAVASHKMWDNAVHDKADEWDPYRFYKMREDPAKQNAAHLVSTGPEHLAFGHGQHACPGRFFAANEVKVALLGILLKYDIALAENAKPKVYEHGFSLTADPMVSISVRRRQEEISLEV